MGLVDDVDLVVGEKAKVILNLAMTLGLVSLVTTIILGVGRVRHRWRRFFFFSRVSGLLCMALFLAFPCDFLVIGICQGIANGFVDPAIDIGSFQRNRQALLRKCLFFFGKVCHHGGGILVAANIMKPLVRANATGIEASVFHLQIPLLLAICCQIGHWIEDSLVLLRIAPKWLVNLDLPLSFVQTASFVLTLLFTDLAGLPEEYLVCVTLGNSIDFVADWVGNKISTHEAEESEASVSSSISLARKIHKLEALSEDDSVSYLRSVGTSNRGSFAEERRLENSIMSMEPEQIDVELNSHGDCASTMPTIVCI